MCKSICFSILEDTSIDESTNILVDLSTVQVICHTNCAQYLNWGHGIYYSNYIHRCCAELKPFIIVHIMSMSLNLTQNDTSALDFDI